MLRLSDGDACYIKNWVLYLCPRTGNISVGQVFEIINEQPTIIEGHAHSVLIQRSIVGDIHEHWQMPRVQAVRGEYDLVLPAVRTSHIHPCLGQVLNGFCRIFVQS
jgi:hypothetical protein